MKEYCERKKQKKMDCNKTGRSEWKTTEITTVKEEATNEEEEK